MEGSHRSLLSGARCARRGRIAPDDRLAGRGKRHGVGDEPFQPSEARTVRATVVQAASALISGRFDRWLNAPGGMAVALSGIVALWVFGYSVTTPWVALSAMLMAGVVGLGIFYWSRFGRRVELATTAGDWAGVRRLLTEPSIVLLSRVENAAVLAIVVLMVVRPA
jgi:uncharacterized membrane protein